MAKSYLKSIRKLLSFIVILLMAFVIVDNSRIFLSSAHFFSGLKHMRKGNFKEAETEYFKAYKIYPYNVNNNYQLGNAYTEQGKFEKAIWAYKEAIKANPGYDEIYHNLGIIFHTTKSYEDAKRYLEDSYRINPISPNTCLRLGEMLYLDFKDLEGAKRYFGECLRWQPTNERAMTFLGRIYLDDGKAKMEGKKIEEALKSLRKSVEISPSLYEARFHIANIYAMKGEHDRAIDEYKQLLKLFPDNEDIQFNLAVCYFQNKNYKLAGNHAEKAVKINPNNKKAKGILKDVEKRLQY